jgi:hypothetical protein
MFADVSGQDCLTLEDVTDSLFRNVDKKNYQRTPLTPQKGEDFMHTAAAAQNTVFDLSIALANGAAGGSRRRSGPGSGRFWCTYLHPGTDTKECYGRFLWNLNPDSNRVVPQLVFALPPLDRCAVRKVSGTVPVL